MVDNKDKVSRAEVNKIILHNNVRQKTGVGLYDKPLTPQQVLELKEWKEYLEYDKLLEERNTLILEIENRKETIKNLTKTEIEYKGGLANFRAKELNESYITLSKLIDSFLGFLAGSLIYGGLDIFKSPRMWIYFAGFSIIMMIIGILEGQRYKMMRR